MRHQDEAMAALRLLPMRTAANAGAASAAAAHASAAPAATAATEVQRADAWRQVSFDCWLGAFSFILHGSTQTTYLLNMRALPPGETLERILVRSHMLAHSLRVSSHSNRSIFFASLQSIAYVVGVALLPAVAPCLYLRYRVQMQVSSRVLFFSFPLFRKPRGNGCFTLPPPTDSWAAATSNSVDGCGSLRWGPAPLPCSTAYAKRVCVCGCRDPEGAGERGAPGR